MAGPKAKCDLVMQGGITSGIVYPGAIIELSNRYTFQSIGGASAGAIGAVGAAAAEYGRQSGKGGFDALAKALADIDRDGALLGLFQPLPELRRFFTAALRMVTGHDPLPGRLLRGLSYLVCTGWAAVGSIAAFLVIVGSASLVAWKDAASPQMTSVLLLLALATWLAVVVAIVLGTLVRLFSHVRVTLERSGFGLCPGSPQPGFDRQALTPWIHDNVQAAAGITNPFESKRT